jgi:hypothetical protein
MEETMNEIMNEIEKKELPGFPNKLNLYDFLEFPRFADSDSGKEAINNHEASIRNGTITKLVAWAVVIITVICLFNTGHPFWAILAALLLGGIAIGITKKSFKDSADARLQQVISQHCGAIAQYLADNFFKEASYFYYFTDALIYDNNICVYFSADSGDFVIYNKSNIKDVTRERVHVGTHTTSTATTTGKSENTLAATFGIDPFGTRKYKSSTTVNTHSQEIYEWHFNIFTDFMPYPNISMVFPDDKFIEDEIGKAYGILKP